MGTNVSAQAMTLRKRSQLVSMYLKRKPMITASYRNVHNNNQLATCFILYWLRRVTGEFCSYVRYTCNRSRKNGARISLSTSRRTTEQHLWINELPGFNKWTSAEVYGKKRTWGVFNVLWTNGEDKARIMTGRKDELTSRACWGSRLVICGWGV